MAFTNLIDNSSTTVSANTPGVTVQLTYHTTLRLASVGVPVRMKVLANSTTADTGSVKLLDSNGAAVLTVLIDQSGEHWYQVNGYIPATEAKYDLHYGGNTTGTLTVYAASCYELDWTSLPVSGTLSSSIGNFTLSSAGTVEVKGDLSQSIGNFTLSAAGTVANGWDTDATSGIGIPSTSAQWTTLMSAAGLATGNPQNLWTMQEASGNILDKIASADLTTSGVTYAQSVTGWTQKALTVAENGGGGMTSSSVGDLVKSHLMIGYVQVRSTPSLLRCVMGIGGGADHSYAQITTAPVYSADDNNGGTQTDGSSNPGTTVRPVVVQVDINAGAFRVYTDQDKIVGPWSSPAGGSALVDFGAAVLKTAPAGYLYGALFYDAAAELTTTQVKTLLTTLGWSPGWTP